MTSGGRPGDRAAVSVLVKVEPAVAFQVFTTEIDLWWRRGLAYRVAGTRGGVIRLEPGVGGRLLESLGAGGAARVVETGRVTVWEPPSRLAFEWRAVNFAPGERTHVEVQFEPRPGGTLVTLVHTGWSTIRPDHPARHGLESAPFLRMIGMWWADLLGSLREHVGRRD